MWPDIATHASIEGSLLMTRAELQPFRECAEILSAAAKEGATREDIEAADAIKHDQAYEQYTRALFQKHSPPESEKLSRNIKK